MMIFHSLSFLGGNSLHYLPSTPESSPWTPKILYTTSLAPGLGFITTHPTLISTWQIKLFWANHYNSLTFWRNSLTKPNHFPHDRGGKGLYNLARAVDVFLVIWEDKNFDLQNNQPNIKSPWKSWFAPRISSDLLEIQLQVQLHFERLLW